MLLKQQQTTNIYICQRFYSILELTLKRLNYPYPFQFLYPRQSAAPINKEIYVFCLVYNLTPKRMLIWSYRGKITILSLPNTTHSSLSWYLQVKAAKDIRKEKKTVKYLRWNTEKHQKLTERKYHFAVWWQINLRKRIAEGKFCSHTLMFWKFLKHEKKITNKQELFENVK